MLVSDQLLELLEQRWQQIERLLELNARQRTAIAAGQMSGLLALLDEKQVQLERLHVIDQQLAPHKQDVAAERLWRTADHRARARQLLDDCAVGLARLIAAEQQAQDQLIEQRQRIADQLQSANHGARAFQAYQSAGVATGLTGHVDVQG